jgi:hypothetical protein
MPALLLPPLPKFKIRASQASRILVDATTYVEEWKFSALFPDTKIFDNRYVRKGEYCEQEAIELLSELNGFKYKKNKRHFENGYMMGTPDIKDKTEIHDIKCSWDFNSFAKQKTLKKSYMIQLQVYMHLTKRKVGYVHFVGIDTPIRFLDPELDRIEDHVFSNLPKYERIKTFVVHYNPLIIKQIEQSVKNIRISLDSK